MGVNLSGQTPRNPYRSTSIFDTILDAAGSLGDGLAAGFQGLLNGVGSILSNAGQVVGDVFHGIVKGVTDFIGWIGSAIGNIFGGGGQADPPPPPPPIYNPIKTNLEQVLEPKFEEVAFLLEESSQIGEALEGKSQERFALLNELSDLNEQFPEKVEQTLEQSEKIQGITRELGAKVDSQSDLIADLTDLNTNFDTKVDQTSSVSGLQDDYRELNTLLWGEQGLINDENKQNWSEQGMFNALQAEMWDDQGSFNQLFQRFMEQQEEIDALQTERADLHEQISSLNTTMLEDQQEFIPRTLVARKDRIVEDDYLHVQPSGSRLLVTAKEDSSAGAWTGEVLMQSAYPTGGATYAPVTEFTTIPTGVVNSQRFMNWPGGEHNIPVFQYWVRTAVHRTDNKSAGWYTTPYDRWHTQPQFTFTAPIDADYSIYYKITWDGTTYNDAYSFRVLKNGQTIMQWGPMTHVGPLLPGQSGRRTRTLQELNVSLKADDVLTFQTWSDAGDAPQRSVYASERKISWLMPYGSTWVLDTNGEGGLLRVNGFEGTIEWNHQDSVRFLISDVVAGTELEVWDGTKYVPTPPGTVIAQNAWIRTVGPHPSSVTFRKRS